MIEKAEIASIMSSVSKVVREYVAKYVSEQLATVSELIDDLQGQIKAMPAGPQGPPGPQGEHGIAGPQGAPGINGKDGAIGERGIQGPQGERGEKGEPGEKGEIGLKGDNGLSIVGEPGQKGDPGRQGPMGDRGEPGLVGDRGEKGIDGKDGRDGRDGKDGKDGEHGRDVLDLEILPAIDPAKTYARGTFAKHAGGLVRMGLSGWDTVVDGVAGFIIEQQGDRDFCFKAQLTSGAVSELLIHVPFLIYRDIHKDGTEYQRGDVVVADNSSWHCQKDGTKARPGNSPDWRLIARKGYPGKDGERGPEGPRGRDLTKADLTGVRS
jgi:Collagen triple helix repeat (20 copies)